jgi:serine/threonine-protein kinase
MTATMPNAELPAGTVLDERFEIEELVNRGGMSCIYRAKDRQSGATVALKVPLLSLESDPLTYSRFLREEEIGRRLNHPYILKVVADGPVKSRPYLAMEWLEGRTLNQLIKNHRPLPEVLAARIASQVCAALEHLRERNIVHRDLKPENIMACDDGSIRLLDFGIAKAAALRRLTIGGLTPAFGTPDYMSPEQVKGKRGDHRSDIYSLGAILYQLVTGRPPFEGDSPFVVMNARTTGDPVAPRERNAELTPVIEEIILHAMERDPNARYQTAADMQAELDDYEKVSLTGRRDRLVVPTPSASENWGTRGVMIALGVIIVQLALFIVVFWYFSHRHGHH